MRHWTNRWSAAAVLTLVALAPAGCNKPAPPPAANAPAAANAAPPAAPAVSSGDAADVKAYLDGLYAHYKTSKGDSFQMFGKDEQQVFDPDTIRLLAADMKASKDEPGVLDGDYLCNCQDFESLQTTVTVQSATPTTAKAHADFIDTGMPGDGARHNDFDLVKVNGAWRIHDITESGQPSLRQSLQDEIKTLAKGPKKNDPDAAP